MPIQVQPCCCEEEEPALPCEGICLDGTTQRELILTVPAGTFSWLGGNCAGGSPPNCAALLEGTFLLEQETACFWPYSPPSGGLCDPFPIATCFADTTYVWSAGVIHRLVSGVQHAILTASLDCKVITVDDCLTIEQGYWELDLGEMPVDCSLASDQTLTLVRRSAARCRPALGSTVKLRAA